MTDAVEFDASAWELNCLAELLNAVDPQHRLQMDDGGIWAKTVDPANVCMVDLDVPADAFDSYGADGDGEIGIQTDMLADVTDLSGAPLRRSADAAVSIDEDETAVTMSANDRTLDVAFQSVNPQTLRMPPERPDTPRQWRAVLEWDQFVAVIRACTGLKRHPWIQNDGGDLRVFNTDGSGADVDVSLETAAMEAIGDGASDHDARTQLSRDYLKNVADALDALRSKPATVTVEFGDDVPVVIDVSPDQDASFAFTCYYHIAPRLQRDD